VSNYRVVKKPTPQGNKYEVQKRQGRGWSTYAESTDMVKAIECAQELVERGEVVVWTG